MTNLLGTIKDIIPQLLQMDMNKVFQVEIKEPKSQRSIEQNRLLWKTIHAIAKQTSQDDMEVYCGLLERADAKSDYIITAFEMADKLREVFRGVRFIRMQEVNGKDCYIYKVYIGSSKMDTKEMTELLDVCMDVCAELGVPVDYYE